MAESKVTAETYEDTCGKDVWDKFQDLRALCHGDTDRELHLLAKLYIAKRLGDGKDFKQEYENVYAMTHGKFILHYFKNKLKLEWPKDINNKPKEVTKFDEFVEIEDDDY